MGRVKICKEEKCKNAATTDGYCRLHYLKHWKDLREVKKKRAAAKLNQYVEFICKNNPENYMDVLRKDIRSGRIAEEVSSGDDELASMFNDPSYEEDMRDLLKELKIEKDF